MADADRIEDGLAKSSKPSLEWVAARLGLDTSGHKTNIASRIVAHLRGSSGQDIGDQDGPAPGSKSLAHQRFIPLLRPVVAYKLFSPLFLTLDNLVAGFVSYHCFIPIVE